MEQIRSHLHMLFFACAAKRCRNCLTAKNGRTQQTCYFSQNILAFLFILTITGHCISRYCQEVQLELSSKSGISFGKNSLTMIIHYHSTIIYRPLHQSILSRSSIGLMSPQLLVKVPMENPESMSFNVKQKNETFVQRLQKKCHLMLTKKSSKR